jgi:formate-nitrite transporter family protein
MSDPVEEEETERALEFDRDEQKEVAKRKAAPARLVHEIVRQQGLEELQRPIASLLWSGFAAGVAIWLTLIAQAGLMLKLPPTATREVVAEMGYSVGFIVVILGRLQLFTESTITAVIPLASHLSLVNLGRTLRLWSAVFLANITGTLAVALIMPHVGLVSPDLFAAMVGVSRHLLGQSAVTIFLQGIPAGFILATVAWVLPNVRGQEIWVVGLLTYLVSLGGFSHVVAGSAEAWLLATTSEAGWDFAVGGFILPALAGNIIGGTGLFAVLAHAQVRSEL